MKTGKVDDGVAKLKEARAVEADPLMRRRIDERIVLTPQTAKRLLIALEVTIGNHERTFGAIETDPAKRVVPAP